MDKIYIVCWSNASQDDDGNSHAYGDVHGIYHSLDEAKQALVEYKNDSYNEIVNNPDFTEEDVEYAKVNTSVYGSVEEQYFEIDYFTGDWSCELYIRITEKELG